MRSASNKRSLAFVISILSANAVGAGLTWLFISATIQGDYGMVLFVVVPMVMAFTAVGVYSLWKLPITLGRAHALGYAALGLTMFIVFVAAMDGVICILMALPLEAGGCEIGIFGAYAIWKRDPDKGPVALIVLLALVPGAGYLEEASTRPKTRTVESQVVIAAPPQTVWDIVVMEHDLPAPTDWWLRTGIAYPITAEVDGQGIGAIRSGRFSTGRYSERITAWDSPRRLEFDVTESPEPMVEISYRDIHPRHLHGYSEAVRGSFELIPIGDDSTRLIGTSWYNLDLRPVFYWSLWTDYFMKKVQHQVLEYIRQTAEAASKVG